MTKRFSVLIAACFFCSCTSTSTRAVMGGPTPPELPEARYELVGQVKGTGTGMVISPGFARIFNAPGAIQLAEEDAVGKAIFDRDDVDMVTAVKMKYTYTDFIGLFETAQCELKAQGIRLESPR